MRELTGATKALLGEYRKAIDELIVVIQSVDEKSLSKVVDEKTSDPDSKSIQTVLSHVINSGYGYTVYIENSLGMNKTRPEKKLLNNVVEYSNVSGGMTKTPTISGGASKSNSVSSTSVRVVSHGSAGNPGGFGGGGGGAVAGAFAFKGGGGDQSYSARGGSGGGGGAGALRQRVFRISEVYGQGITVTVGAGGAGGSAGGGTTALGAAGGNGGAGWVLVEW